MEKRGAGKREKRKGEIGDRKGKEQANPAEKQRVGVKEKEEGVGGGGSLGKRYKNREKWRNAEGERGRPGKKDKRIRKRKEAREKNR